MSELDLAGGSAADAGFIRRTTRNIRVDGLLVRAQRSAGVRCLASLEQQGREIGERRLTLRTSVEGAALQR